MLKHFMHFLMITNEIIYIYIYIVGSKLADRSRGRPKDFLSNSYYTKV